MEKPVITPKMKIYDLLEAFPELEKTLVEAAPDFKKLRNPVLRNTVARMATISQAATIGGIPVDQLVNTLREKAGQNRLDLQGESTVAYITEQPEWHNEARIAWSIDIQSMINAGEQPVHEVLSVLRKLEDGKILEVKAPFIPVPLLDKATSLGYRHWLKQAETVTVWFCR